MNHTPHTSAPSSTPLMLKSTPVPDYRPASLFPPHSLHPQPQCLNPVFAPSHNFNPALPIALTPPPPPPVPSPSRDAYAPLLPEQPDSDADSSQDSKLDDLATAGPGFLTASADVVDTPPQQSESQVYEPVDFDFCVTVPGGKTFGQANSNFRDLLTADYLEEREFDFKELLRRERNRAAAHRSNIKKKQQKEARKTELAWLQGMERQLRARELDLRRQNKCLRALVYLSGQRLPLIPVDRFQQVRCFPYVNVDVRQVAQAQERK